MITTWEQYDTAIGRLGCCECQPSKMPDLLLCQKCKEQLADADAFIERLREQEKKAGGK